VAQRKASCVAAGARGGTPAWHCLACTGCVTGLIGTKTKDSSCESCVRGLTFFSSSSKIQTEVSRERTCSGIGGSGYSQTKMAVFFHGACARFRTHAETLPVGSIELLRNQDRHMGLCMCCQYLRQPRLACGFSAPTHEERYN
jgi:hypothetical protein